MVFSGIAIGFMGWGVWAHHMFASGIGPLSVAAFSLSTMFIAVPTGVKILNWLATMWGGKLRFTTPMLFAVGLVTMFTIGGLSGVTHAVAPSDTQQTDTYYIVAHFHYVIFGGALLGFLGGIYFWWPKVFGYLLEREARQVALLARPHRLQPDVRPDAHPRPAGHAPPHAHLRGGLRASTSGTWSSTVGAFIIAVSMLIFVWNIVASWRKHRANPVDPGPDPWDARSLEWMIQSPVPAHNFDECRPCRTSTSSGTASTRRTSRARSCASPPAAEVAQPGDATGVHLPSPSYWPLVLALGLPVIGYGLIFNLGLRRGRRRSSS